MNKLLIGILSITPLFAHADNNQCAAIESYMELSLFDAITNDLNIPSDSIIRSKTQVNVLDSSSVSPMLAKQLAHIDYEADKKGTGHALLSEKEYQSTFQGNGAKTITAKYTYLNSENKKDIFIATSLMNNDECSIRFNGYLVLSRQF